MCLIWYTDNCTWIWMQRRLRHMLSDAADTLMNPDIYIDAVLNDNR